MLHDLAASSLEIASPIPLDAPVINAFLFIAASLSVRSPDPARDDKTATISVSYLYYKAIYTFFLLKLKKVVSFTAFCMI